MNALSRTPSALLALLLACATLQAGAADLDKGPEPASPANYRPAESALRSDTIKLVLKPEEQIEVKALIAEGQAIVYEWSSKGAKADDLYVDFHGHNVAKPGETERVIRYSEGEQLGGRGAIVAPLSGEHGWFWLNMGTKPVTIELRVQGFHSKLLQHRIQSAGKS